MIDSNIVHSVEGAGFALQNGVSHSFITNNLVFQVETQLSSLTTTGTRDARAGPSALTIRITTPLRTTLSCPRCQQIGMEQRPVTGAAIGIFHADSGGGVQMPTITGDLGHNTYRNNILPAWQTRTTLRSSTKGPTPLVGQLLSPQRHRTMATDTWTDNISSGTATQPW